MILKHAQVRDLEKVSDAARRFAAAVRKLAAVSPRTDRMPVDHPELQRLARDFDQAAVILEAAVKARVLTGQDYARVARRFEAIAEAMERGAGKEAAADRSAGRTPRNRGRTTVRRSRRPAG